MALTSLRDGLTLEAEAAASWARMEAHIGRLDVNRSYADWDTQMGLYNAYQRHLAGGPWAPLALHPKYSMHCQGLAVDTDDDARVRANPRFGWVFNVPSEKWHAEYRPNLDQLRGTGFPQAAATGTAVPFPAPAEPLTLTEDSMRIISWAGHVFTVGQEYVKHETHLPHIERLAHLYQPGTLYYELDNGGIDAVQLSLGIPWRAFELVLQGEAFNNNGDHASGDGRIWSRQMEVLDAVHGIQSITGQISRTLDDVRVVAEATPSPIAG